MRIAVFLNGIEPLFIPRAEQKKYWGIVRDQTSLARYAASSTGYHLIPIQSVSNQCISSLDEMLQYTNLTAQLKAYAIDAVLVPSQSSRRAARWAAAHSIKLLGTPSALQVQLEDKLHFDSLLRVEGIGVPPRIRNYRDMSLSYPFVVIQKRRGMGGFGTTIAKGLPSKKLSAHELVRAYIPGIPLGISIFMDGVGNFFCSGVRRQCYAHTKPVPRTYLGIQWLPTDSFTNKELSAIQRMTEQLIALFSRIRFTGVANIDFILYRNRCFVIECNPRFSGATPHIVMRHRLTPHPHPWQFLMNAFLGIANKPIHNPRVPKIVFRGSAMDVDTDRPFKATGCLPVGCVIHAQSKFVPTKKNNPRALFIAHDMEPRRRFNSDDTVCTVLSDAPLFTLNGTPTMRARALRRACLRASAT